MRRSEPWSAEVCQIQLQDAIDASDIIGRWEYDVRNDRVYADALVALLFNIDPRLAEKGAPLSAFLEGIHPEDREKTARLIAKSAKDGLACAIEYRVRSADGMTRWILDRGRIALDKDGRPSFGSGILIDITQTKLNETIHDRGASRYLNDPLERAAEHCLAAREAIQEMPKSVLHQMSDMLLIEIGRRLAKLEDSKRRSGMN